MDRDITKRKILGILIAVLLLSGCSKSSKSVIRLQKLEEGVVNPTTVEELQVAIKKYQDRVMDIQLANGQVAIWYKMLGVRYLDAKMYGEALKSFEAALQFYPDNENLYYYVGLCAGYMSHAALDFGGTGSNAEKNNYLRLAEEAYSRAIQINPRYTRALYALGVLYVFEFKDSADKAITPLETLLTIDTKNTDAMFILARAYISTGMYDKAITLYDEIIRLSKSEKKRNEALANKKFVMDAQHAN